MTVSLSDMEQIGIWARSIDDNAWNIGDKLLDIKATRADRKQIADAFGLKAQTLKGYEDVAREVPPNRRYPNKYSFSVYKQFCRIVDETDRWALMFSRDNWPHQEAVNAVNSALGRCEPREVRSRMTTLDDVMVRITKSATADAYTVKVTLGLEYDVEIDSQNAKHTIISFSQ